jgi:hypothetical protein
LSYFKFVLFSALAVIGFDAVASIASLALDFPYPYASLGSAVIYISLAFAAALRFGFGRGVFLGALLGVVDATAGWAVSWAIGPGQVTPGQFSVAAWAITLGMVVTLGAICGLIGAGVGTLVRGSRAA